MHKESHWTPSELRSGQAAVLTSLPSTGAAHTAAGISTWATELLTAGPCSQGQSWNQKVGAMAVRSEKAL